MHSSKSSWESLVRSVRQAEGRPVDAATPAEVPEALPATTGDRVPFGFATRVVGRWQGLLEAEQRLSLWQRLAWRMVAACAVMVGLTFLAQPRPADVLIQVPTVTIDPPGR
jgi:hypothetical protein